MKRFASLLVPLMVVFAGCTQVDTGNVGVVSAFGKVEEVAVPQGLYQTVTKSVLEVTTKEVGVPLTDLKPKSKDNLTMQDVDVDVYYSTVPTNVAKLYTKYQGDVARLDGGVHAVGYNRVLRESREGVFKAISGFDATTMHTQRDELAEAIREKIQQGLDKSDPGSFVITTVNVKSLVTDANLEQAIRDRAKVDQQIEAQQAIAAKNGNTTIVVPSGQPTLLNVR